jgi:hypothetical protein
MLIHPLELREKQYKQLAWVKKLSPAKRRVRPITIMGSATERKNKSRIGFIGTLIWWQRSVWYALRCIFRLSVLYYTSKGAAAFNL